MFRRAAGDSMKAVTHRLSGKEWEAWANKLLTCRYGPTEYQTVPDTDKGDAGIEGFTVRDGHAYQAYGCNEPLATSERYEHQRRKLTKDIGKFITNACVLGKLFGTTKICRWVLFVPFFDSKEIVSHATAKTAEVINAALPYVASDFRIVICQESDFSLERDKLLKAELGSIFIGVDEPSESDVVYWTDMNSGLVSALNRKIRKLPTLADGAARSAFCNKVLGWYLEGESVLEELRSYPEIFENVIRAKTYREKYLAMTAVSVGGGAQQILKEALSELGRDLERDVSGLHDISAEVLTHGTIADWLLRCPLDFPGPADHV